MAKGCRVSDSVENGGIQDVGDFGSIWESGGLVDSARRIEMRPITSPPIANGSSAVAPIARPAGEGILT